MMHKTDQEVHIPVRTTRRTRRQTSIADVAGVLYPLDAPPSAPGWNHDALEGMVGGLPCVDAAVLMAIRDAAQPTVVFTLRRDHLAQHAGQVSFPGGRVEASDGGVLGTALRESAEEVALDPGDVQPLGFLDCLETVSGYLVTPVVASLAAGAALAPQPGEVARVFEVPLAFLLDPANLREQAISTRGLRRMVYEYHGSEPRIWGVTALVLVNLMRRMKRMP
jgi:8-oxo-dGTP pyrophosphatase MutT (NUDIX family)